MEEKEIEEKIAKKITEAKLDMTEKRFQHFMWFCGIVLAIVGVIIPIYNTIKIDNALSSMKAELSNSSTLSQSISKDNYNNLKDLYQQAVAIQNQQASISLKKVDDAVQDMQNQFKELAGNQLRKPILKCFFNNKEIDSSMVLDFNILEIKNIGDETAKNVKIYLYINTDYCDVNGNGPVYNQLQLCDEINFKRGYLYPEVFQIAPKESSIIQPEIFCGEGKRNKSTLCMLKIFYEQPEPVKYFFKLKF